MPPDLLDRRRKGFRPLDKLKVFVSGLRLAVTNDRTVAVQVVLSLTVLAAAFVLREWLDALLILAVTGFVLATELTNTAIEALSDYVQPDFDPKIGAVKDVAAAATGIALVVWLLTLVFEVGRLWRVFQG